MKRATPDHIPLLVDSMDEFYAESGYKLDRPQAARAFEALLADERLGSAWVIEAGASDAGYLVLVQRFAMEYGGLMAIVDDLFVRKPYRNAGLASHALMDLREYCVSQGIRAISVEVGPDNAPARALYRRSGFVETDHLLLTMELGQPAQTANA